MRLVIITAMALVTANLGFAATVTQVDRAAVVAAVTSHLESEYVDPTVGGQAATQLRRRFDAAALKATGTDAAFAEALTRAPREETGDGHLKVEFSETPLSEDTAAADKEFTAQELERYYGAHRNFGVRKAERLEGNIGLLERATVIGERSGGGAHPFNYRRIHPHFVLWSVTQKSLNPITGKNWQGTGVQPDVVVDPQSALDRALALIEARSKAR